MNNDKHDADILLVGFGFSAIPLLRELDLSGIHYTVISEKNGSVWAGLDRTGALDFDLVSSYYTSFYTFDLVQNFGEDRYPTAREFYDMHLRYYEKYKHKIIDDFVTHIENKADHSIVHTRSGKTYRAKNVIISTAFKRKVHASLNNFDFSISNKTVVMNTIGDSANLMIAKLVTGGNRVICLQNGFLALDKLFRVGNTTFTLDQLESHQVAKHFKHLYRQIFDANFVRFVKFFPRKPALRSLAKAIDRIQHVLGRMFTPHNFHVPFSRTRRTFLADHRPTAAFPNGCIAIKYWPIDSYEREFKDKLEEGIEQGYLLNDLPFFAAEGLVELLDKSHTKVDEDNQRIEYDGQLVEYDFFIEGDSEVPRFPRITYERNGEVVDYQYKYRNTYFGVIPRELQNLYLIGYTRPLTGGLANITEMQSLLVHKLLTDETFSSHMTQNLPQKIENYNKKYYFTNEPTPTDHLTVYGFYTEEVATELDINLTLKSCRTLKDLMKYFTYPNNANKYRQRGPYKINGTAEFIDKVYTAHGGFKILPQLVVTYGSYQILFFGVGASLFFHGWINGYVFVAALVFQWFCGYWAMIPVANTAPFYSTKIFFQLLYLPMLVDPRTTLAIFPADFLITYIMRKLPTSRYIFGDLKKKRRFRPFFERYKEAYNRVRRGAKPVTSRQAS